jgi:hypothetical protein
LSTQKIICFRVHALGKTNQDVRQAADPTIVSSYDACMTHMHPPPQDVRQAADPAIVSSLPVSEYKAARPRSATSHATLTGGGEGGSHRDASTVDYDAWSGLHLCHPCMGACMCHVGKQLVVPGEKKDEW